MPSDTSEQSTTMLDRPSETFESEKKRINAYDPPFLLRTVGRNRIPHQRKRTFLSRELLSRLKGWPAMIICGQLLLQALAWGLFAWLQTQRGVALPYRLAGQAKAHPHIVDWIATIIATILAFVSTLLFSHGICKSTTLHMRGDGMSMTAFVSSVKLSTRSLIWDRKRERLSVLSLAVFLLTGGVQTAGWKALITPYAIDFYGPIVGHEIDLSKPLQQNDEVVDFCVVNGTSQPAFIVGETDSGYAAAKGELSESFPSLFTVMDQTFNISTGGIFPLTLFARSSRAWFRNTTTVPATVKSVADLPRGLGSWYLLNQQGFTAEVSCELWDPDIFPPLFTQNTTVKDWATNAPLLPNNLTYSTLWSECGPVTKFPLNQTYAYTLTDQPNFLSMIACPSQDSYKLIFNAGPTGIYRFIATTICTLTPKITNVEVSYYSGVINTVSNTSAKAVDIGGPATLAAINTLHNMVFFAQAAVSNSVADKLKSLVAEIDGEVLTYNTTLRLMEQYIRGVTEFSTSVFKACLSAYEVDTTSVMTEGRLFIDTFGWIHASFLTFFELIPSLVMAIFTIYAVVTTVSRHDVDSRNAESFDPSDPMHLVAASAAGGLDNVFIGTKKEDLQAAEHVDVFLGASGGRAPALVRSSV
ncbi:hypothetical protein MVEN_01387700 [Mycena venus]|uniref:Uncharacterized protein n=1 Tax=Mycena venus TaxID=2733690 RepID=A0A8H6XXS1_9AGAR|nr:hypothetical protein MVEN_01387700 [Mycena venus]